MSSNDYPLYGEVRAACERYPEGAGPLFHAYRDLKLCASIARVELTPAAQRWVDLELVEVPSRQLYVIQGRAKSSVRWTLSAVLTHPGSASYRPADVARQVNGHRVVRGIPSAISRSKAIIALHGHEARA